MPIYTYVCHSCGAQIERRQSFSDASLTSCEACGGALRKVFHPVGVIFKGSGFYNTDYKNSNGNGATKADGDGDKAKSADSKTDSTPKGEAKPAPAESKPAPKSEPASAQPAAATKD